MYKYYAFISYSSKDIVWGKRLQKKLEGYRMPSTMCSEHGWKRKPINPVFFAPSDIQPGGLNSELQERLKASRNLIVICSPNSAKSEWVGKEIEYFHSLGRTDNIHFFIVDGIPNSGNPETECFNPVVANLGLPEILGANVHEKVSPWPWINRERAYIQLITKLLGIEFDSIWQRHKRILFEKCILWVLGIMAVLAIIATVWVNNQPVEVRITTHETSVHNDNLPPLKDAIVTLTIDNDTKTDTIESIDIPALFKNIPHSALGKKAQVRIECRDWLTTDTTLVLGESNSLNIERDPKPYGNIQFMLWNVNLEKTYPGTAVTINGHEASADEEGMIRYSMPLAGQDTMYVIKVPDLHIDDTLRMPTTQSTIIEIK
ncbi:MAG: toll/interleukin-1 receptor domain-containing protein [Bacteroidales bacterium]|nr:toll/interleukin-1 receptor domain-containing protein [Candidatus Liminaster caballi]